MKTLIISDVHLGSPTFKKKEKLKLLLENKFDQIIINGDFYELLWFKDKQTIDSENADLVSLLNGANVVWLGGNHDDEEFSITEFAFTSGNKKIMITHGHKFEGKSSAWITRLNIILYLIFGIEFRVLFKWVKSGYYARSSIKLSDYYNNYDWVIIGHHHNLSQFGNVINCGDWIEHSSYIVIENGEIKVFNLD